LAVDASAELIVYRLRGTREVGNRRNASWGFVGVSPQITQCQSQTETEMRSAMRIPIHHNTVPNHHKLRQPRMAAAQPSKCAAACSRIRENPPWNVATRADENITHSATA
jgi:hypothetical protein